MSWASSAASRRIMQANHRRDTRPELAIRRLLHARGLRYRVDHRADRGLRSRADIAFTRRRVAVYVDGCFWHRCPEHGSEPKANADYWGPKLDRNVERDREVSAALARRGWLVLRFWEHEAPESVAAAIASAVAMRSGHGLHSVVVADSASLAPADGGADA